jgi:hypothetical protein
MKHGVLVILCGLSTSCIFNLFNKDRQYVGTDTIAAFPHLISSRLHLIHRLILHQTQHIDMLLTGTDTRKQWHSESKHYCNLSENLPTIFSSLLSIYQPDTSSSTYPLLYVLTDQGRAYEEDLKKTNNANTAESSFSASNDTLFLILASPPKSNNSTDLQMTGKSAECSQVRTMAKDVSRCRLLQISKEIKLVLLALGHKVTTWRAWCGSS